MADKEKEENYTERVKHGWKEKEILMVVLLTGRTTSYRMKIGRETSDCATYCSDNSMLLLIRSFAFYSILFSLPQIPRNNFKWTLSCLCCYFKIQIQVA